LKKLSIARKSVDKKYVSPPFHLGQKARKNTDGYWNPKYCSTTLKEITKQFPADWQEASKFTSSASEPFPFTLGQMKGTSSCQQ
jgi:hypothetical protein